MEDILMEGELVVILIINEERCGSKEWLTKIRLIGKK